MDQIPDFQECHCMSATNQHSSKWYPRLNTNSALHSPKFITIRIGIPSWIPNSAWNSNLNTDLNWNSKLNCWSFGRVYGAEEDRWCISCHRTNRMMSMVELFKRQPGNIGITGGTNSGCRNFCEPIMCGCLNFAVWVGDSGPIGLRATYCSVTTVRFSTVDPTRARCGTWVFLSRLGYDTYIYVALGPMGPKSPNQMAKFKRPRRLMCIVSGKIDPPYFYIQV